jgi:hypothetical protein
MELLNNLLNTINLNENETTTTDLKNSNFNFFNFVTGETEIKKPQFKQKFIHYYETFFSGDEKKIFNLITENNTKNQQFFWEEFFLLKVNTNYLNKLIDSKNEDYLLKIAPMINLLFKQCLNFLKIKKLKKKIVIEKEDEEIEKQMKEENKKNEKGNENEKKNLSFENEDEEQNFDYKKKKKKNIETPKKEEGDVKEEEIVEIEEKKNKKEEKNQNSTNEKDINKIKSSVIRSANALKTICIFCLKIFQKTWKKNFNLQILTIFCGFNESDKFFKILIENCCILLKSDIRLFFFLFFFLN